MYGRYHISLRPQGSLSTAEAVYLPRIARARPLDYAILRDFLLVKVLAVGAIDVLWTFPSSPAVSPPPNSTVGNLSNLLSLADSFSIRARSAAALFSCHQYRCTQEPKVSYPEYAS